MPFSRHVAPAISPLRRLCVSRCVAGRRQLSISSQSRLPALQSYYASSSSPIPRCVISSISPSKQRLYSSSSSSPTPTSDNNDYPKRIAIIGGGISGLASAHFISKAYPKSQITVFEKEGRVGGWVMSERIEVNEEGRESKGGKDSVLFEYGARTLRPGVLALPTMQLIQDLNLNSSVVITPKSAPGAKYRYIYYPDRLNLLPSSSESLTLASMSKLYNSGIIDGIWHSLLEPLVAGREDNVHDESIGDFISRRVDPRVADNIVSAVFHGIYAGDIYQLSARTLLNKAWQLEGSRWSSVIIAYMDAYGRSEQDPISLWQPHEMSMIEAMLGKDQDRPGEINVDSQLLEKCRPSECATLSFKGGMQQLVDTLAASLQRNKNVSLATHTMAISVQKVKPDSNAPFSSPAIKIDSVPTAAPSPDIELKHTKASAHTFDFVIDTQGLSDPGRNTAPLLAPAVTVMTVNLWYAQPKLCPVPGFGYLIPRSVPLAQNPERALGVIFDHDMNHGQDSGRGTKLTVMIGGHWWDGFEPEDLPTEDDGREMAMAVVRRHLGIEEVPDVCRVRVNRECIPQYTVGYEERLQALDSRVSGEFGGRVRLVGNRVDGVGVNDCVRGAWHLASRMKRNGWRSEKNGLEVRGGATKGKPKLLTYHTSGKLWRLAEKGKGLEGKAVEV